MTIEKIYKIAASVIVLALLGYGGWMVGTGGAIGPAIAAVLGIPLGLLIWFVWGRELADKIAYGVYSPPDKFEVPAEKYAAIKTAAVRGEPDKAVSELRAILEKAPACREAAALLADVHETHRNDPVSAAAALQAYFAAAATRCFDDVAPAMRLCDILSDKLGDPGSAAAFLEAEVKRHSVSAAKKALTLRLSGLRAQNS
jgi:hypothetical protein